MAFNCGEFQENDESLGTFQVVTGGLNLSNYGGIKLSTC